MSSAGRSDRIQVVDFFSGCGGMSYGFQTWGDEPQFALKGALDVDEHANATYRRMLGIVPVERDIRDLLEVGVIKSLEREWGIDHSKPLLVIGCAPCQGFSSHRKKDPRSDDRNDLLEVFASVIVEMNPDVVVMENVPEMLQAKHWSHFANWRRTLESAGYRVRARIYNLAQFGIPQERFRAVVLAWRGNVPFEMPQPLYSPAEFATVRDAIGHLRPLRAGGSDQYDPMHITSRHRAETVRLIEMIPKDGGSRRSLPPGVGPQCWAGVDGFRDVYGRLSWDRPSVAITARCRTPSCGRFVHPEQDRGLSVREAALLQGFPPDYYFEGPFDDKFKQIGNAVSPTFAAAIARHVAAEWTRSSSATDALVDASGDIVSPFVKSFSSSIASLKRKMRVGTTRLPQEIPA